MLKPYHIHTPDGRTERLLLNDADAARLQATPAELAETEPAETEPVSVKGRTVANKARHAANK